MPASSTSGRGRVARSTSSGMLDASSSPDTVRDAVMAAVRSYAEGMPSVDPSLAASYAGVSSLVDGTRVFLDGVAHALASECEALEEAGEREGATALAYLLGDVLDTLDEFGGPIEASA